MDLLTSLPPEILPTIFGFLPLEDRKNIRLTCQSFREACDRTDIIKHEKFVFHFGFVQDDIDATRFVGYIGHCERLRSTVEFRGVNLTLPPLMSVWETLGKQMTSLSISGFTVTGEVLANIFLHCPLLVNIHLNVICETELFRRMRDALDQLIAMRIERPKLQSFKAVFQNNSLSNDIFRKIFTIFPNIRTFGRGHHYRTKSNLRFLCNFPPDKIPIELPPSIENFFYSSAAESAWMVPYIRHPTLRFKELALSVPIENSQEINHITELISSHTELKRLDLRIPKVRREPRRVKNILFKILKELRKLEVLKFHAECAVEFTDCQCADLLEMVRNLKSLDLSFTGCSYSLPITNQSLPSLVYPQLTHLRLDFGPTSVTQLQSEILTRCRVLESLSLTSVDEETMEHIFKDHTGLKELIADCSNWRNITGTEEYFVDRLQKLECLDLRNVPNYAHPHYDCPRCRAGHCTKQDGPSAVVTLASKLHCPKMKVFSCRESWRQGLSPDLSNKNTLEVVRILARKTPQLETLRLHSCLHVEQYRAHFSCLKKLRYLVGINFSRIRFYNLQDKTGWPWRPIFDACPSVIYLIDDRYGGAQAYFYNRTTNSLVIHYANSYELICDALNVPTHFDAW